MSTRAHCDSFPLCFIIEKMSAKPVEEAMTAVKNAVLDLGLDNDIKVDMHNGKVRLSNVSVYGAEVLEELSNRTLDTRCGKCDYGSFSTCKRCGHPSVN